MYSLRSRTSEQLRQSTIEFPCRKRRREPLVKNQSILSDANTYPIAKRTRRCELYVVCAVARHCIVGTINYSFENGGNSHSLPGAICPPPLLSAGMPTTRSSTRAKGGPPLPLSNKENRPPQSKMKIPQSKVVKSSKKSCEKGETFPQCTQKTPARTPAPQTPVQTPAPQTPARTPACQTPARTPGRGEWLGCLVATPTVIKALLPRSCDEAAGADRTFGSAGSKAVPPQQCHTHPPLPGGATACPEGLLALSPPLSSAGSTLCLRGSWYRQVCLPQPPPGRVTGEPAEACH